MIVDFLTPAILGGAMGFAFILGLKLKDFLELRAWLLAYGFSRSEYSKASRTTEEDEDRAKGR